MSATASSCSIVFDVSVVSSAARLGFPNHRGVQRFVDGLRELSAIVRLRQEPDAFAPLRAERDDLLRVPRSKQHGKTRSHSSELLGYPRSAELTWKHHVGQQQVQPGLRLREGERGLTILRLQHAVTKLGEEPRGQPEHD